MLNADSEIFVIHVVIQKWEKMAIDPIRKTLIEC